MSKRAEELYRQIDEAVNVSHEHSLIADKSWIIKLIDAELRKERERAIALVKEWQIGDSFDIFTAILADEED